MNWLRIGQFFDENGPGCTQYLEYQAENDTYSWQPYA